MRVEWTDKRVTAARTRRVGLAVLLAACAMASSSCSTLRVIYHGPSNIDDHRIFPGRGLARSAFPRPFPPRGGAPFAAGMFDLPGRGAVEMDTFLKDARTAAFIVVRDGAILCERYYGGYNRESLLQIFSVTKSVFALLVGCALRDGILPGLDTPVTSHVPELAPHGFDAVTIRHLLQMTSGIDYAESDNPFSLHPRLYYSTDLLPQILGLRLEEPPGTRFRYKSGDTQLLGLVLSRALADRGESLTGYAQKALWDPLGMEYDGDWGMDREGGLEKTFCCLSMRAIDLAKIGEAMRLGGSCDGRPVLPAEWVAASTVADTTEGGAIEYRYGWWLFPELEGGFMGSGHLGQYLIVLPRDGLVVVRLGEKGGEAFRADVVALAQAIGRHQEYRGE
jgi:CubicO group peptidase (beta-lactamase class C family)